MPKQIPAPPPARGGARPGAGRPAVESPLVTLSVRLPWEQVAALRTMGGKPAEHVRAAVAAWLARHKT